MRTILIVDDEKVFRKKYKKLLKKEGYRVIEAPSALEVTDALMRERSNIDLILLDINLPEVDGKGIFDIIDEYAPSLDIIITSVHPLHDQKLRIPRASDYYSKMHSEETLLRKIRKVLGVNGTDKPNPYEFKDQD